MSSEFWSGAAVGAIVAASVKWLFDYLRTVFERGTLLVVSVHRAFPGLAPPESYFIRLVNHTPDRELEIKDVWYEGSPSVPILNPQRPLPTRIRAGAMWESWIPIDDIPTSTDEVYGRFRVRLSTGEVYRSRQTPESDIEPGIGAIAGP